MRHASLPVPHLSLRIADASDRRDGRALLSALHAGCVRGALSHRMQRVHALAAFGSAFASDAESLPSWLVSRRANIASALDVPLAALLFMLLLEVAGGVVVVA